MGFPITHKDLPGSLGEAVDDLQFAEIWEPRGWERAPIPDEFVEPSAALVTDDAADASDDDAPVSSRHSKNAPDPTVESIEGV